MTAKPCREPGAWERARRRGFLRTPLFQNVLASSLPVQRGKHQQPGWASSSLAAPCMAEQADGKSLGQRESSLLAETQHNGQGTINILFFPSSNLRNRRHHLVPCLQLERQKTHGPCSACTGGSRAWWYWWRSPHQGWEWTKMQAINPKTALVEQLLLQARAAVPVVRASSAAHSPSSDMQTASAAATLPARSTVPWSGTSRCSGGYFCSPINLLCLFISICDSQTFFLLLNCQFPEKPLQPANRLQNYDLVTRYNWEK